MRTPPHRNGFTIVEMLVSVSVIGLLMALLLPAIGKARDQARITISRSNLHQLGLAHASYAADWNDRQLTIVNDNLARYGDDPQSAAAGFHAATGSPHPSLDYGWGPNSSGQIVMCRRDMTDPLHTPLLMPIAFSEFTPFGPRFGWFRIPNVKAFNGYVNDRHYDPFYYAPKDMIALAAAERCNETPYEMLCVDECFHAQMGGWSSYCLSPAALFSPEVMQNEGDGGWQDPFALPSGLRAPAFSQVRYSDLKTHMLEHHWLQNTQVDCNADADWVSWSGCEPYYFNHARESVPMSLFYDGHVEGVGVLQAMDADARLMRQSGGGTWLRSTPWGDDGYFVEYGYDTSAATSFHVLTSDGVRGRDVIGK